MEVALGAAGAPRIMTAAEEAAEQLARPADIGFSEDDLFGEDVEIGEGEPLEGLDLGKKEKEREGSW